MHNNLSHSQNLIGSVGAAIGHGYPPPKDVGARALEIPSMLGNVEHRIDVLEKTVDEMIDRLCKVCAPPSANKATEQAVSEPTTELGASLNNKAIRIARVNDRLLTLLHTLEV